jgi:TolB-like protein
MQGQTFLFGDFVLDAARGTLARSGEPVPIGHRAFTLLQALVQAEGQVLTKAELIDAAWPGLVVEESNLSVQIAALRKLLAAEVGNDPIATVARVGYRFCLPVTRGARSVEMQSRTSEAPQVSIAVLPLVNLSGNATHDYLADGVTEDIIMALSRFRWFRVTSRGSSFAFRQRRGPIRDIAAKLAVHYLLEGSLRVTPGRIRVSLQLNDAASESQCWGEHYDFAEGDVFAMQDSIAERVAGAIEPELLRRASADAATAHNVADSAAQDLVYRGVWLFHKVGRATHLEARELFREACRIDAAPVQPQYWLARVSAGIVAYGWSDSVEADLQEGIAAAIRAIRSDERSPYAHYALAITSIFAMEFAQAMRAAQRAIELAPGFALGHLVLGMARLYAGDAPGATAPLSHGLQLNRFDPQNFVWYNTLAWAQLFAGEADAALAASRQAQEIRPDWAPALESAVCATRVQGDEPLARQYAAHLQHCTHEVADALWPLRRQNPAWDKSITRWLQME